MIKPSSSEQLNQTQELLRDQVRPPVAEARNVALAAHPHAASYFRYRGQLFKAPPLQHSLGVELQEIALEYERLQDLPETVETLTQLRVVLIRAAVLCQKACKPLNPITRFWYWVFRINPFMKASPTELAELTGFFSMCRTKSRVRLLGGESMRPSLSTLTTPKT